MTRAIGQNDAIKPEIAPGRVQVFTQLPILISAVILYRCNTRSYVGIVMTRHLWDDTLCPRDVNARIKSEQIPQAY